VGESATRADGRRTDTRKRINDVALDVFSERGYEGATLQEIAERLDITRPALYYHYRSKEEILAAIHRDLALSIDTILDQARAAPRTTATRADILTRLHELMAGPWGKFTRFAQASEAAMRDLSAAEEFTTRMDALGALLAPSDTVEGRMKGRLALTTLFMASARISQLGGTDQERVAAAFSIATQLIANDD
jgi:AcrR family transcriptional regulator